MKNIPHQVYQGPDLIYKINLHEADCELPVSVYFKLHSEPRYTAGASIQPEAPTSLPQGLQAQSPVSD